MIVDDDIYLAAARAGNVASPPPADVNPELLARFASVQPAFRAAVDAGRKPLLDEMAKLAADNDYLSGIVDEVEDTNSRLLAEVTALREQIEQRRQDDMEKAI